MRYAPPSSSCPGRSRAAPHPGAPDRWHNSGRQAGSADRSWTRTLKTTSHQTPFAAVQRKPRHRLGAAVLLHPTSPTALTSSQASADDEIELAAAKPPAAPVATPDKGPHKPVGPLFLQFHHRTTITPARTNVSQHIHNPVRSDDAAKSPRPQGALTRPCPVIATARACGQIRASFSDQVSSTVTGIEIVPLAGRRRGPSVAHARAGPRVHPDGDSRSAPAKQPTWLVPS